MFSNRRPGKRSIIGTRVCAPNDDGFYYPGAIQAMAVGVPPVVAAGGSPSVSPIDPTTNRQQQQQGYVVLFDDGSSRTFTDRDLIGAGFQTFTAVHAKPGQVVFITLHGREVKGRIVKKENRPIVDEDDQVLVAVGQCPDEVTVTVRLDDVRLIESRKSARLIDQEMDYIRLADLPSVPEGKKRTVSNVIDVPTPCAKHSRGSYSRSHDHGDIQQNGAFRNSRDIETEIMDEHMAALVLTSLSCSPVSPVFPPNMLEQAGTSPGMSYCNGQDWETFGHGNSPSPPQLVLSQSAPAKVNMFTSFCFDEGIINGDVNHAKVSKRTVFQCTWPGCHKIYNTCPGIEKHVRLDHLGPKEDGNMSASDHEEDFYFTEVEVTLDTVVQTFADMHTSSPPAQTIHPSTQFRLPPDHDYQRKEFRSTPLTIPKSSFSGDHHYPGASLPMSVPDHEDHFNHSSLSWQQNDQLPALSLAKSFDYSDLSPSIQFALSGPKSSSHKKSRNDVKKCRKVYGLENRSSWCTQCKWKKACTRFLEKSDIT